MTKNDRLEGEEGLAGGISNLRAARAAAWVSALAVFVASSYVFLACASILIRAVCFGYGKSGAAKIAALCLALNLVAWLILWDTRSLDRFRLRVFFSGRLAWIGTVLTLGSFFLAAAMLFEGTFYASLVFIPRDRKPFLGQVSADNHCWDKHLGYAGMPGIFEHKLLPWNGYSGFDVLYTQNEYGCRVVPQNDSADKNRHLLFFGCSFTYGVGCGDSETLPARTAAKISDYNVYNFALGGYGPAQCLSLLLFDGLRTEVREPDGLAVYVFIEDHILRAIGSMRRRNAYVSIFPTYQFEPDGTPRFLGQFENVQPIRTWLYRVLPKEQFIAWSGIDWPIAPSDADIEYTADLLAAARRAYCAQFNDNEFYVLIHPFTGDGILTDRVRRALETRGVTTVDYSKLLDLSDKQLQFSDWHPTPACNEKIANELVKTFQLK